MLADDDILPLRQIERNSKIMSISHKESKTFFSQMGPPTLLGGMFVLLGLGLFSITLWEKGFSGLQKGQIFGFALTIILGIALRKTALYRF